MTVTKGDILAAIDVLTELINESDQLPVDEALAFHELLGQLQSETKRATGFINTTLKSQLEAGAKQLGDRVYAVKDDGVYQFRHDAISRAIRGRAIGLDLETGEMNDTQTAVDLAIQLMAEAYRMPSSKPKEGLLKKLGLTKRDVSSWTKRGKKIVVTDLGAPGDDE
jgi:hypothetical protein